MSQEKDEARENLEMEWMELCINVASAAGADCRTQKEWVKIVNECGSNRENALLNLIAEYGNERRMRDERTPTDLSGGALVVVAMATPNIIFTARRDASEFLTM